MSDGAERRVAAAGVGVAALALIQLGLHLYASLREVAFLVEAITVDDTYYYLQTAWNHKALGFPTFDGRNGTNGVQFLWYWIVLGVGWLFESKESYLRAVVTLSALLSAACYLLIWRIGRLLASPLFGVVGAICWFYLNVTFHRSSLLMVSGLENALAALLIWGLVLVLVRVAARQGSELVITARDFWLVTLLLSGLVLTRLDALLLAAPLYLGLLWAARRTEPGAERSGQGVGLQTVYVATSMAALCGLLMAGFNRWAGGSWLPVSGLIKQDAWSWSGPEFVALLEESAGWILPAVAFETSGLSSRVALAVLWLGTGLLAWRGLAGRGRLARHLALGLGAVVLFHTAWIAGYGTIYNFWYRTPLIVLLVCVVAFGWSFGLGAGRARAALVSFLALLALPAALISFFHESGSYVPTHHAQRLVVAEWVGENTPPDARLAAWNAGELAFFGSRPVVNLDGLINSYAYYRDVLIGEKGLEGYLEEQGVSHVVDYGRVPVGTADVVGVELSEKWQEEASFPVGQDLAIGVWARKPAPTVTAPEI